MRIAAVSSAAAVHHPQPSSPRPSAAMSMSGVLRPISANPLAEYPQPAPSRHSRSASNSVDSCAPALSARQQGDASASAVAAFRPADAHAQFIASKAAFAAVARGLAASSEFVPSAARSASLSKLRSSGDASGSGSGVHAHLPHQAAAVTPASQEALPDSMDVDVVGAHDLLDQMEPSSSSHDAKLLSRPSRSKTTPDAKRAQNRESAKRFRVAQKKRWAELQETVLEKDAEIARLKGMLQEVTNQTLSTMQSDRRRNRDSVAGSGRAPSAHAGMGEEGEVGETAGAVGVASGSASASAKVDALAVAELDLFVKLLCAQDEDDEEGGQQGEGMLERTASSTTRRRREVRPPLAADIGSLHRVIVSKLNGSVLGVRHENSRNGCVMGGDVGGCLWEHVHSSDSAHLRASVVHAKTMLQVMGGQPSVFSYRRRERVDGSGGGGGRGIDDLEEDDVREGRDSRHGNRRNECYIRMKGCLYPLMDDDRNVNGVILAEFIEL